MMADKPTERPDEAALAQEVRKALVEDFTYKHSVTDEYRLARQRAEDKALAHGEEFDDDAYDDVELDAFIEEGWDATRDEVENAYEQE